MSIFAMQLTVISSADRIVNMDLMDIRKDLLNIVLWTIKIKHILYCNQKLNLLNAAVKCHIFAQVWGKMTGVLKFHGSQMTHFRIITFSIAHQSCFWSNRAELNNFTCPIACQKNRSGAIMTKHKTETHYIGLTFKVHPKQERHKFKTTVILKGNLSV
ncbi:hypothetical protein EGR_05765 [Echinococcus granulosus]|uniref:Uncharacterized protein n=1 Tax=Echinococcus granulosus TaxID=6210 RepID=W6UES9_ECHGR|nr:hypothetical protein EGR_05765 [Echinococcus granulosus]EUB59411.1 hypothetical protein EGR_05765 [Echinococcus granulosus]